MLSDVNADVRFRLTSQEEMKMNLVGEAYMSVFSSLALHYRLATLEMHLKPTLSVTML